MNETNSITSPVSSAAMVIHPDSDSLLEGADLATTLDSVHYITFVINLLIFIADETRLSTTSPSRRSGQTSRGCGCCD